MTQFKIPQSFAGLAIAYSALAVLLSLPIETHAVRLDMPSAGDASATQLMPLLVPAALIAAAVLVSALMTRALAAVSAEDKSWRAVAS